MALKENLPGGGADRNLLFGVLALQMDFITRDQLVAGMNAWVLDKASSLGQILVDQKVLGHDRFLLLQALVQEHLKQHNLDPQQSLQALSDPGSARKELEKIADLELVQSLGHVAVNKPKDVNPNETLTLPYREGLGRFRILRPHAKGGLGEVFVASDQELGREVALKQIQRPHSDHEENRARFVLEAEITGSLEHPGIVPVYSLGHYADGRPFYAMRFIKGDSLKEAIEAFHKSEAPAQNPADREVALRKLLRRFYDVCNALEYAHSRGVLHRDLKPGNIMLGKYGETLVVDWGLAKAGVRGQSGEPRASATGVEPTLHPQLASAATPTQAGSVLGTPAYMSPEQASGNLDQLGPASDVYSLGATLYTLLTGKLAFTGSDEFAILAKVRRGEFDPPRQIKPDVPAPLEAICLKAMSLKPQDRYPSVANLGKEIERWLDDQPVEAWPEPGTVRARRWVNRHRMLMASSAAAVLVALMSLGVTAILLNAAKEGLQIALGRATEAEEKERKKAEDLAKANKELDKKADELEITLARSLLRPLGLGEGQWDRASGLADAEHMALWELASNKSERLGFRFIEEALRDPLTTSQLRNRADLALNAAIRLDARKRLEVERLLIQYLIDPKLDEKHKTDIAIIAAQLGDLTEDSCLRAADLLVQDLTKEPRQEEILEALEVINANLSLRRPRPGPSRQDSDSHLLSLIPNMKPNDLSQSTAKIIQSLIKKKDPSLAEISTALLAHVNPQEASHLSFLATASLEDEMKRTLKTGNLFGPESAFQFKRLAKGLSTFAPWMEPKVAARRAFLISEAVDKKVQPQFKAEFSRDLISVWNQFALRMKPMEAASFLIQRLEKTELGDSSKHHEILEILSSVVARMDAAEKDQTAAILALDLTKEFDPVILRFLAQALAKVATLQKPGKGAATLGQAMAKTNDRLVLSELGYGISIVASHLEPQEAVSLIIQAMNKFDDSYELGFLTKTLSSVAANLSSNEATQAAETVNKLIAKNQNPTSLRFLIKGFAAFAARMEFNKATQLCSHNVIILKQVVKDNFYYDHVLLLAQSFSALSTWLNPLEAKDATAILTQTMTKIYKDNKFLAFHGDELAKAVGALSLRIDRQESSHLCYQMGKILAEIQIQEANKGRPDNRLQEGLLALAFGMESDDATSLYSDFKEAEIKGQVYILIPLATRMTPKDIRHFSVLAASSLNQAMRKSEDLKELTQFAIALSLVLPLLDNKEASHFSAEAINLLNKLIAKKIESPLPYGELTTSIKLAPFLESVEAGKASSFLIETWAKAKNPDVLYCFSEILLSWIKRVEKNEASSLNSKAIGLCHRSYTFNRNNFFATDTLLNFADGIEPDECKRIYLWAASVFGIEKVLKREERKRISSAMIAGFGSSVDQGHTLIIPFLLGPGIRSLPSRFSTQELVELLKQPVCVGATRRLILDQLENRYNRSFIDHWAFVRFAKDHNLDLDFSSPPVRPSLLMKDEPR